MNEPQPCGYCQFEDDNGVMCRTPIPPGYLVCADCYDYMREVNPYPDAIEVEVVEPTPIRWGRWVPPIIFMALLIYTLVSLSLGAIFVMLVLVPGAALGWFFGFGPGRDVPHYEPGPGTEYHDYAREAGVKR